MILCVLMYTISSCQKSRPSPACVCVHECVGKRGGWREGADVCVYV